MLYLIIPAVVIYLTLLKINKKLFLLSILLLGMVGVLGYYITPEPHLNVIDAPSVNNRPVLRQNVVVEPTVYNPIPVSTRHNVKWTEDNKPQCSPNEFLLELDN